MTVIKVCQQYVQVEDWPDLKVVGFIASLFLMAVPSQPFYDFCFLQTHFEIFQVFRWSVDNLYGSGGLN